MNMPKRRKMKKVNPREIIDEDAKMIIINKDSNLKFTPLINNNVIKKYLKYMIINKKLLMIIYNY